MANTIGLIEARAAFHTEADELLREISVSSNSKWTDHDWHLDNPTPGQSKSSSHINWAITLPDGSMLTDRKHAPLLGALRRLIWSLFVDPRESKSLKPGTLGSLAYGLRSLVQWMQNNRINSLSHLTPAMCERYLNDSVEQIIESLDQDVSSVSIQNRCWKRFRLLELLYFQSTTLPKPRSQGIPSHPFGGANTSTVVAQYADKAVGWIPPVPDEVALPVMNAAWRLLGTPAKDVISLQERCLKAFHYRLSGAERVARNDVKAVAAAAVVKAFEFSTLEGEATPWRKKVTHEIVETVQQEESKHEPLQIFRNLICDIRDAAVITIQSQVGLRVNEICGLNGEWDEQSNLPACIEIRRSKTGINEIFYLHGWLSKTRTAKEPVEWVMGLRPVGSDYIPPAVHATMILQKLYRPWREMAEKKRLIISFRHPRGVPRTPESTGPISGANLLHGLKSFTLKYVDLSKLPDTSALGEDLRPYKESRGKCLRTHQWRKSWALYIFRTDTRMVSAIAQQFKHLSLAMTEQGYIGSDPNLITALNSTERQSAARFFYEAATGRRRVAGNIAKLIEVHRRDLNSIFHDKSRRDAMAAMEQWIIDQDLRIWFSDHGKCLIGLKPTSARCHEVAGTQHWARTRPNFETREPSVCAGCSCYAIDGDNGPFWVKRYKENQMEFLNAKARGRVREGLVPLARARQAAGVLKTLGIDLPEVEDVQEI